MAPKRNLFLHLSALSDTEYATYVEALQDIMDADDGDGGKPMLSDEEFEGRRVSIPVVRAWMKGRFRDLGSAEIDKVLQLFALLTPQKEMSGGQLLAALRLLMHARHGQEICEGNVFVQADPSSPTTSRISPSSSSAKTMVRADFPTTDAPPSPPKTVPANLNPFFQRTRPPIPPPTDLSTDPRRASLSSASGLPPIYSKPRVDGLGVPPGSTNPFLQRAKTHSGTYEPSPSGSGRTPPLPPRKPSHISSLNAFPKPPVPAKLVHSVPPRQPNSSASVSSSSNSPPNAPSPSAHFVTPLMQQSLLASRVGASLKRAQDEAERTRVLEVIRSSADSSVSRDRTKSPSRSPDRGTRRPVPRPPRKPTISSAKSDSGAPSEASLAEVASARLTARSRTKPTSPDRISLNSSSSSENENENEGAKTPSKGRQLSASEQFSPPPTHPARRPSARSSSSRGRHVRSPSYQWHGSNYPSSAATSPFTKSSSAPGVHDKQSSSPSPSPSPVSPVNSRPTRSQSMHQPSSPSDITNSVSLSPLPPPRRKRPESAQFPTRPRVLDTDHDVSGDLDPSSPFSNSFGVQQQQQSRAGGGGIVNSMAARFDKVSFQLGRESEPERERERDKGEKHKDTFVSLQRTFSALQQRAEPAITRARFKAEAGILAPRRGFVPNGRDYHMAGEDGDRLVNQSDSEGNGGGMDFGVSTDQDYEEEDVSGDETIRFRGRSRSERTKKPLFERDDLKLPEGEGWTKL